MNDNTRAECERNQISHSIRRGEEERGVGIVCCEVETVVGGEHARDVVDLPEFVVGNVA